MTVTLNVILNVVKYPIIRSPYRLNVILNVVKYPKLRSPYFLPWDSSSVALRMTEKQGFLSYGRILKTAQKNTPAGVFFLLCCYTLSVASIRVSDAP